MILLEAGVRVPLAAAARIKLHESDATLDESAGQEAHPPEAGGLLSVEAVKFARLGCLLRQINRFRRLGLHLERQLIAGNAGLQLRLRWPRRRVLTIQLSE